MLENYLEENGTDYITSDEILNDEEYRDLIGYTEAEQRSEEELLEFKDTSVKAAAEQLGVSEEKTAEITAALYDYFTTMNAETGNSYVFELVGEFEIDNEHYYLGRWQWNVDSHNSLLCNFVLLMDIQMPVMDGYETTKRIRSLKDDTLSAIPIVAMTANAFDEDRRATKECGMNGFISKPISIEELIHALNSIFGK